MDKFIIICLYSVMNDVSQTESAIEAADFFSFRCDDIDCQIPLPLKTMLESFWIREIPMHAYLYPTLLHVAAAQKKPAHVQYVLAGNQPLTID